MSTNVMRPIGSGDGYGSGYGSGDGSGDGYGHGSVRGCRGIRGEAAPKASEALALVNSERKTGRG